MIISFLVIMLIAFALTLHRRLISTRFQANQPTNTEKVMQDSRQKAAIASLWDDAKAAAMSEPELLLYRSNLLGSDLRITNFGGGNTSAKVMMEDPLTGGQVEVLWVKG